MKQILLIPSIILCFIFISCYKNKIEPKPIAPTNNIDPHNRTLIGISLDTLRKIIAGTWLQKSKTVCGVAGCFITNYATGQEDTYYFLTDDTVKRVKPNGSVNIYDKAVITVSNFDSTWFYSLGSGTVSLNFYKINNDTLILDPLCGGCGSVSKLVKKP